jgi:hypothetical protein
MTRNSTIHYLIYSDFEDTPFIFLRIRSVKKFILKGKLKFENAK